MLWAAMAAISIATDSGIVEPLKSDMAEAETQLFHILLMR